MARPSRPAGGVAIGGPSAASSLTPRPVTQAEGGGRPSSPPLARLRRLLLLPTLPLSLPLPPPLLPRAPLCVRGLPRGTEGLAGAGAFSALDLDSDPAPGEVGRRGSGPLAVPPWPLYGSVLKLSPFQHCAPNYSALSPESLRLKPPAPAGAQLGSPS